MSDTSTDHYIFDQSHADHQRLIRQARVFNELTREGCLRAGLRPGDRAIDVGCGPLGALPILAELVGPAGAVVGLDRSASALAQARQVLDALEVRVSDLIQGDVNALSPEVVAPHGPFDLAHCRFVLMYQADPGAALRQVARVVRPGGRIVALDLLQEPRYLLVDPPVPAVERTFLLLFGLVEGKGGMPNVARSYRQICEQAGVRLIERRGLCPVARDPRDLADHCRDVLLSMRETLVALDLTTDDEIDGLAREIDAARETVQFGRYPLGVEMIAEVP